MKATLPEAKPLHLATGASCDFTLPMGWYRDVIAQNFRAPLTGVTATLCHRSAAARLERVRTHFSEQILLARLRGDNLWRDAAIAGRDFIERELES